MNRGGAAAQARRDDRGRWGVPTCRGARSHHRRRPRPVCASRASRLRILPALSAVLVISTACTSLELVPIQMSRVGQLEVYEQTFRFEVDEDDCRAADGATEATGDWQRQRCLNRRIDADLGQLVGARNWQALKDLYGFGTMREELLTGDLVIRGYLSALIYLDPRDTERFHFDAVGRFFLLRGGTGEILLNGDFHTLPRIYAIADLDEGFIEVDIQQLITRIPGQHTFLQESTVRYRIHIDRRRQGKDIYAIDYGRAHEVFLVRDPDRPHTSELRAIGALHFRDRPETSKLLDLRGRGFLRQDYGEAAE
jgi:hypothetical protein